MTNEIKIVELVLTGKPGSPLVIHKFDEKAKQEIRDKQAKKPKLAKQKRNHVEEFEAAKCLDANGYECAPVTAIKKAMISAATSMENLTKVALRQAIFVAPASNPA